MIFLLTAAVISSVNMLSSQEIDETQTEEVSMYGIGRGPMGLGYGSGPDRSGFNGPGFGPGAMKRNKQYPKGRFLNEEIEKEVIDVISKNDPSFASKILELKKSDKIKYDQFIRVSANLLSVARLDKSLDKDIVRGMALEFETRELALKYRDATQSEKEKIKKEIKTKLNELFDIRTKIHEFRLKKLEERVKELKADIDLRKSNKAKIVENRLEELISRKTLKW